MSGTSAAYFPEAPKYLGLSLIACGIAALTDLDLAVPVDA